MFFFNSYDRGKISRIGQCYIFFKVLRLKIMRYSSSYLVDFPGYEKQFATTSNDVQNIKRREEETY